MGCLSCVIGGILGVFGHIFGLFQGFWVDFGYLPGFGCRFGFGGLVDLGFPEFFGFELCLQVWLIVGFCGFDF